MGILSQPETLRGREFTAALNLRKIPKVLLHEPLDGGLRPTTVIDLAAEIGYGDAFAPYDKRLEIITDVIVPAFVKTRAELS